MDFSRRVRLALLALPMLLLLGGAASPQIVVRSQAWTLPGETLAWDLTHAPGECLIAQNREIEIGRALFRSPALLGGPAARAGLSCNACHSNGRTNTRFLLPELTDRAGAADVTSEWTSRARGDGVFNPVNIPDLVDVSVRDGHGRNQEPSLERFTHSVIVDEFQGQEPPQQAFAGLMAYLRALRSDACTATEALITLTSSADDVRRTLVAASNAETATARLLLLAGQDATGRLVERLPRRRFARERQTLENLSRELGALRHSQSLDAALDAAMPGWRVRFDATVSRIARRERQTYFNEATLRRALKR